MIRNDKDSFAYVAYTHFVPCFFIGIVLLYVADTVYPERARTLLADQIFSMMDITVAAINGIAVAASVLAYHYYRNRRLTRIKAVSRFKASNRRMFNGVIVGFISGSFDVLLGLHNLGIFPLTVIVLFILVLHLRSFSRQMVDMLKPGNVATWGDVSELMRIYMTMLAGFTLVNATLEGMHLIAGRTPPFGFNIEGGDIFLNSLYYTVVTMTTLGFGDIVPKTWDGKLLLIFQCLVSYFMFALVVGIVTRGVIRSDDRPNSPRGRS